MGFDYTYGATKADIVRDRTKAESFAAYGDPDLHVDAITLAHSVRGNVLWTVRQYTKTRAGQSEIETIIGCDLLAKSKDCGWGYKSMEESMHPYYYTCPLSYLDMAPETSPEWRVKVRQYHARLNQKLEVGQVVRLEEGVTPNRFTVLSVKPLRGYSEGGTIYRIPRARIVSVETV